MSQTIETMLEAIHRDTSETRHLTGISSLADSVTNAMLKVPRESFVPADSELYAYENRPLGIGYGQTISQPFIVALMTDLLDLQPDMRVLEIGTGSGYQAAVLSVLANEVYTIEIVPELATSAAATLAELGYNNVQVRAGNGRLGWPEAAPFDRIIVTAVGEQPPPRLVHQLAVGGKMVIPIGPQQGMQHLSVIEKSADGISIREVLPVRFVPLTGSFATDVPPAEKQ